MAPFVRELSEAGVKINVTAVFTTAQVELLTEAVRDGAPSYISVFAGRIADAGIDPMPIMKRSVEIMVQAPKSELIWASPREILNVIQADQVGCHIITVTPDLLKAGPAGQGSFAVLARDRANVSSRRRLRRLLALENATGVHHRRSRVHQAPILPTACGRGRGGGDRRRFPDRPARVHRASRR